MRRVPFASSATQIARPIPRAIPRDPPVTRATFLSSVFARAPCSSGELCHVRRAKSDAVGPRIALTLNLVWLSRIVRFHSRRVRYVRWLAHWRKRRFGRGHRIRVREVWSGHQVRYGRHAEKSSTHASEPAPGGCCNLQGGHCSRSPAAGVTSARLRTPPRCCWWQRKLCR